MDVALIPRDVLSLQLVGRSSDPGGAILDFIEIRDSLSGVHDY